MPIYCYQSERTGQIIEQFFPIGEAPKRIVVAGSPAHRSFSAENKSVPAASGWPIECVASGVHADQAGELSNHLREAGVPTEVSADGNPIYRDRNHRRKALKARGMVDRSSFV